MLAVGIRQWIQGTFTRHNVSKKVGGMGARRAHNRKRPRTLVERESE